MNKKPDPCPCNTKPNNGKARNEATAEVLSMYIKYGVFVLHYGDEKCNKADKQEVYQFTLGDERALVDKVKHILKDWFAKEPSGKDQLAETVEKLFNKIDLRSSLDSERNRQNDFLENLKLLTNQNDAIKKEAYKYLRLVLPRISQLKADFPAFIYLLQFLTDAEHCNKLELDDSLANKLKPILLDFLDALKGKIVTVAFSDFTDHIRSQKNQWWQKWSHPLLCRELHLQALPRKKLMPDAWSNVTSKHQEPVLYGRHMYRFPQPEIFSNIDELFEADAFNGALTLWKNALNSVDIKPIVLVLKAVSSGDISHFITRLARPVDTSSYTTAEQLKKHIVSQYQGMYVVNSALSVELLSVLDGVMAFICQHLAQEIQQESKNYQSRLDRFRYLLRSFMDKPVTNKQGDENTKKRLVVVFAHFDTLLSEKSDFYSTTVAQFIRCYEDVAKEARAKSNDLCIDFILIGNEVKLERFIRTQLMSLYHPESLSKLRRNSAVRERIKQGELKKLRGKLSIVYKLNAKPESDFKYELGQILYVYLNEPFFGLSGVAAECVGKLYAICDRIGYSYYALMLLIGTLKYEIDSSKDKAVSIEYVQWLEKVADDVSHSNNDFRSRVAIAEILFRYTSLERKSNNPAWRLEVALRLAILRYMSAIHHPIPLSVLVVAPEIVRIFDEHRSFLAREGRLRNSCIEEFVKVYNQQMDLLLKQEEINEGEKQQLQACLQTVIKEINEIKDKSCEHILAEDFKLELQNMCQYQFENKDIPNLKQWIVAVHDKFVNCCLEQIITKAMEELLKYYFSIEIISCCNKNGTNEPERRFALHRVMQEQIERIHGSKLSRRGERNFYDLNCLITAPRDMPFLDRDRYQFLTLYVDKLLEKSDDLDVANKNISHKDVTNYAARIRAAFSILRSHINLSVLARVELMPDLNEQKNNVTDSIVLEHQVRLKELSDAAMLLTELSNQFTSLKFSQPLYIDEISWLNNERAIFAYAQGKYYQAMPLFGLAVQNNPNFKHELSVRSGEQVTHTINHAITMIERGAIQEASTRLIDLKDRLPQEQLFHQYACDGLLGRIYHISGRLADADIHFQRATDGMREMDKFRTLAMFGRNYAQLLAVKGDTEKARHILNEAIASAESMQQQDVLHYCRFTEALMDIAGDGVDENDYHFAMVKLEVAARYAERMGMYELLAKTCFGRAQVLLATRQTKGASELAAQGLALATKYGMALMEAKGIVIYGNISIESGDVRTGKQLLKKGIKLAERMKYQVLVERAHQSLMAINNNVRERSFGDYGIKLSVDSYLGF